MFTRVIIHNVGYTSVVQHYNQQKKRCAVDPKSFSSIRKVRRPMPRPQAIYTLQVQMVQYIIWSRVYSNRRPNFTKTSTYIILYFCKKQTKFKDSVFQVRIDFKLWHGYRLLFTDFDYVNYLSLNNIYRNTCVEYFNEYYS